jgi:hypothetical protein
MAHPMSKPSRIPSNPNLVMMEIAAAMLTLVGVCLVSAVLDAPVTGPADPLGIPSEGAKAPWIFVGIQQLLRYFPPIIAGICFPLAALVAISALPLVPGQTTLGRYASTCILFGISIAGTIVTIWGYVYE